jgi:hypothetical protein
MSLTADGLEARGLPANVPDCRLDDNRSASLRASTMLVKAPCLPTTRTRAASHSQLFVLLLLLLLGDARETGDAINKLLDELRGKDGSFAEWRQKRGLCAAIDPSPSKRAPRFHGAEAEPRPARAADQRAGWSATAVGQRRRDAICR